MPISFVILTYNSARHIDSLFNSLFKVLDKGIKNGKIEIVLLDNASTDDTLKRVKKYEDKVKVIESKDNLGYGKGINKASNYTRGELIVVINPDARLEKFEAENILREFEKDKNLAILGFLIKNDNGKREKNAGRFFNPISFLLYALGFTRLSNLRFSPSKSRKVDFVSGGFVAFQRKHFKKLGGYDEDYFMYVEDMDICYRAKKEGLSVGFSISGCALHEGQGSSSKEFAVLNIYKGLLTFYRKHKSKAEFYYVKNLLVIKALLIIFLSSILGRKDLGQTYKKALDNIR